LLRGEGGSEKLRTDMLLMLCGVSRFSLPLSPLLFPSLLLSSPLYTQMCKRYIVRHFDDVSRSEAFHDLPKELIIEIIRSR